MNGLGLRTKSNGFGQIYEKIYNERRYSDKKEVNALKVNERVYRNVSLDHFEAQDPLILGNGGNSVVQCYKHSPSDTVMALKKTRIGQPDELASKTKVTRDIEHLRKLRGHHNIITLYGYFEMCGEAVICMERMETCFHKILQLCIRQDLIIPTKVISTLCYSLSNALCYLKENKTIHRDIKPANILLSSDGRIKLSDFGGSGFLYDSYSFSDPTITNCYAAPERIDLDENFNGKKAFDCTADVWSLGVSVLELATREHPFAVKKHKTQWNLMDKILKQPSPQLLTSDPGYDEELANFIARCLEKQPCHRMYPKLKQGRFYIMKHGFIALEEIWFEKQVIDWYSELVRSSDKMKSTT